MDDLIKVTVADGKYTMRQVEPGKWECLRYGETWPAFEGRQPDNLHTALAIEVDQLLDKVDGLSSDLDSAVEVAYRRGAVDWVRQNYPAHFERLSAGLVTASSTDCYAAKHSAKPASAGCQAVTVTPSELTSDQRSEMQDLHGLCWNTDDDFDDDVPEYREIMQFHRSIGTSHWYLPFHETLKHEQFATELDAYMAAGRLSEELNR